MVLKASEMPHKAYLEDVMDALAIVFDDWEQVLAATLPKDLRKPYREAIVKFRYWLRQTGRYRMPRRSRSIWSGNFFQFLNPVEPRSSSIGLNLISFKMSMVVLVPAAPTASFLNKLSSLRFLQNPLVTWASCP